MLANRALIMLGNFQDECNVQMRAALVFLVLGSFPEEVRHPR